jgi:AcrR family transcriptional regulator
VSAPARLPAAERRQAIVEAAVRVFTDGSYRGSTTAEIARAAGVSEPILYRHFDSKRDLYLAALDHVWEEVRAAWAETLTSSPDACAAFQRMGERHFTVHESKLLLAELWAQALTEASEDAELRRHLRRHLREVHAFVAGAIRRGQAEGGIAAARDPEAEAWIFIAGGMLGMVGRRIGLLGDEELARIRAARLEWLSA